MSYSVFSLFSPSMRSLLREAVPFCSRLLPLVLLLVLLLLVSVRLFAQTPLPAAAPTIVPRPPEIAASSYILMDAKTGYVLMEKNADESLPPASLTKIMTAYIVEQEVMNGNLGLDTEVHISEKAWRTEGSKMFVGINSNVRVEDLLRGIIIQSGNDASVAVAEHIAGSEDAFADMMNQYAAALGMENSFFMNSSGLDTPDNYNMMSARDLAIVAQATIVRHPDYYPLYAEREFTYNEISQSNRNTLLFRDRNVDGLKTGWTEAAGYCLVASSQRDGMRLISVVMGTASEEARAVETQKLFTYGFRYFETHKLYDSGQILANVPIWSGRQNAVDLGIQEEVYVTIPRGQASAMTATMDVDEIIRAPLDNGQIMGVVNVVLDNNIYYTGDVVTMQAVERGGIFKRFIDWLSLFFTNLFSG